MRLLHNYNETYMEKDILTYSDLVKRITLLIRNYELSSGDNIRSLSIKNGILNGSRILKISSLHYGEQQDTV